MVTVFTDRKRRCLKRFDPRITDCDDLRGRRVVGYLYRETNKRSFCLIFFPTETDAGPFIYLAFFMMKESFAYQAGIQELQCPGIPVPFLFGSDTLCRYRCTYALVVFCNATVGILVIVSIQIYGPVAVQLIQRVDLFGPGLCYEIVCNPMEFFDLLSEYSDKRSYPQFFIIRTFPENAVVMRVIL